MKTTRRGLFGFLAGAAAAIPAVKVAGAAAVATPACPVSPEALIEMTGLSDATYQELVGAITEHDGLKWRRDIWREYVRSAVGE